MMSKNEWFKKFIYSKFNAFRVFDLISSASRDVSTPPEEKYKNWNDEGAVPVPRDQGKCMTCSSFAITTAIETLHYINNNQRITLSPGFIHTCLFKRDCNSGAGLEMALELVKQHGVAYGFNNDYPFPERLCKTNNLYRITDTQLLPGPNSAMHALLKGPVVGEMKIDNHFANVGASEIYEFKGPTLTTHAVAIVGYDLVNEYWIIANSSGPSWGDKGIGRVAFESGGLFSRKLNGVQIFI